jgi:UDP-GlcNAc:undecaprenyl-phosphate/decaprenyl-phosphate GlcNAc-1-phosphate transferase
MQWIPCLGVFLSATIISYLLVPLMRRLAFRFEIVAHPGHHRTHQNVQPMLGGGAIFAAFMLVILSGIGVMFAVHFGWLRPIPQLHRELVWQIPDFMVALPRLIGLLLGGTIMFLLGLTDDRRGVGFSYRIKFAIQILAALLLVICGIRIEFLPSLFLNGLVTVLWIVGITNSFNLLDNMDGLSSGVATIISLILAILTIQQGQYFSTLLFLTLAGSMLGFLRYNFNPSSIFMGDAGSLFIGYMLAALTVSNSYVTTRSVTQLPIVVPVLVLGVPLFDTLSVIIIRFREKRPLFVGDKCHFSHRLRDLGMSVRQTVIFIYLVTICVGVSAILIPQLNLLQSIIVLIQEALIFGLITLLMIKGKHLKLLHLAASQDLEQLKAVNNTNGQAVVK